MKLDTLFKRINRDIFNNELETPIFSIHWYPNMYGFHTNWDGTHIIAIMAELEYRVAACTLAHEMIHQWQLDNGYKCNHGKRFKKIASKIEKMYNLDKGEI